VCRGWRWLLFEKLEEDAAGIARVDEGVALPFVLNDAAEGFDAGGAEGFGGFVDGGDFAADVMHTGAALVEEGLDEAIRAVGGDDFELKFAIRDEHDCAVVLEGVTGPAVIDFHAEDALLEVDLLLQVRDGHRDVVDAIEADDAAVRG
jgi:hypothetical protein